VTDLTDIEERLRAGLSQLTHDQQRALLEHLASPPDERAARVGLAFERFPAVADLLIDLEAHAVARLTIVEQLSSLLKEGP
jgi:hypothetical protein